MSTETISGIHPDLDALLVLFPMTVVEYVGRDPWEGFPVLRVAGHDGAVVSIARARNGKFWTTGRVPGVPTRFFGNGPWLYVVDI